MKRVIHVLLAMRNGDMAHALQLKLEQGRAVECCVVMNGEDAVASVCLHCPDIMVLDCVLPLLDGLAVMDRLHRESLTPKVIGLAMMPFAERGFRQREAARVLCGAWTLDELGNAVTEAAMTMKAEIDWDEAAKCAERAELLLSRMGMRSHLRGYAYLACAAALACEGEERLYALRDEIYVPVADHFHTTPQSVERLIRHAVERAMDSANARGMYSFFGNTIDPARGKPTNAQAIGMIAERLRMQARECGTGRNL